MHTASGKNGVVEFDGQLIYLRKTGSGGWATLVNQGLQGDRYIVAKSLTAVEFRGADRSSNGFIAFDFPGKNPPRGGVFDALADENAVVFTSDQHVEFEKLKDAIVSFLKSNI